MAARSKSKKKAATVTEAGFSEKKSSGKKPASKPQNKSGQNKPAKKVKVVMPEPTPSEIALPESISLHPFELTLLEPIPVQGMLPLTEPTEDIAETLPDSLIKSGLIETVDLSAFAATPLDAAPEFGRVGIDLLAPIDVPHLSSMEETSEPIALPQPPPPAPMEHVVESPIMESQATPGQPTEACGNVAIFEAPKQVSKESPQLEASPLAASIGEDELPPPAKPDQNPHKIKILLVEDGNFLRRSIERALIRACYNVVTAPDGEAGIAAARKSQPDLILLDLLLPKIGGQDVLKTLKKDPATAEIAIVVLTGLSQMNAERLLADGASAFLEKSELALEKGPDFLIAALSRIVRHLPGVLEGRKRAAAAR